MSAIKLSPFKSRTILLNRASIRQPNASAENAGWLFSPSTSGSQASESAPCECQARGEVSTPAPCEREAGSEAGSEGQDE